ncbi:L-rhamnose mutarotase [Agromyces hippuratus]|uniref:L-rhamnose mutarotase n=1 Tax=Agromyces hippuratus TaxID=286438 RepID=A0A852WWQ8_9MICO|nr:L-rhamnose mutarotase [Agromyces hippuratus]NYG19474.1 L-rhamnose mutarotase [Agromyces hippuratus]
MRVALHSVIRAGAIDGYRSEHAVIPDDLERSFARLGIHDWTIWRSGDRLFHVVECDDFDAAMRELDSDPANLAWQQTIGEFVETFRDADGDRGYAPIEEVWDLRRQRGDEHRP